MSMADTFTLRDITPERDNRWQARTSNQQSDFRTDSLTKNQNIIRLPVTSTIVKESSSYVALPQSHTTVTRTTLPITTTVSSGPVQIGIGQAINITSSNSNIPASCVVGPATITSNAPRQLQGSFGTLPSPSLNLSITRNQQVSNSLYRPGSSSNINSRTNFTQIQTVNKCQYDRSVNECKSWQSKYYELNNRFNNLSTQISNNSCSDSSQLLRLRQQNKRLQQRVMTLQQNQRRINQNIEVYLSQMINKYRQLTLKQSSLLFDRFRLQCRAMDKQ